MHGCFIKVLIILKISLITTSVVQIYVHIIAYLQTGVADKKFSIVFLENFIMSFYTNSRHKKIECNREIL